MTETLAGTGEGEGATAARGARCGVLKPKPGGAGTSDAVRKLASSAVRPVVLLGTGRLAASLT